MHRISPTGLKVRGLPKVVYTGISQSSDLCQVFRGILAALRIGVVVVAGERAGGQLQRGGIRHPATLPHTKDEVSPLPADLRLTDFCGGG